MFVEHAEAAAGNHGSDIAAAEAHVDVGREHGVIHQAGLVGIAIDGVSWENNGIVRRKGSGDDFVNADAGAGDAAIKTMQEAGRVSDVRAAENSGLFHGTANFAAAGEFGNVVEATTKFRFRTRADAASHEHAEGQQQENEGQ